MGVAGPSWSELQEADWPALQQALAQECSAQIFDALMRSFEVTPMWGLLPRALAIVHAASGSSAGAGGKTFRLSRDINAAEYRFDLCNVVVSGLQNQYYLIDEFQVTDSAQ